MEEGPRIGRSREQRWSPSGLPAGAAERLEALITAEFRVIHQELAEIRASLDARVAMPTPPPAPVARAAPRRGLGRGLDALITPVAATVHAGESQPDARTPEEQPKRGN